MPVAKIDQNLFAFPGFLLLIKLTVALYDSSDDVVQLTSANFDRLVTQSDSVWVIEFFAPWCTFIGLMSPF